MVYQYTALGDSLTTGFGALPGSGFVPVYRRMSEVALRSFVAYTNLGVNGLTTSELEQRVRYHPLFRQSIREADLITVSIGGNDLIHAAREAGGQSRSSQAVFDRALQESKGHLAAVMSRIYQEKQGASNPWLVRIVGLYNPYPQMAGASDWVQRFNRQLAQYCGRECAFADIYDSFAGHERELLSIDRLHPNGRGYRLIADRLQSLGYSRLLRS
ncbi:MULTISPECIES: GDSL-type esterase/lipase family protein [Paenibacillus]|uniref:GDSL-type esterase/lipase family protein n=1 Tax=Paenibacillus TaxID=44249 RepID=UPI001F441DFA|nr:MULTISPECIES: GDSL-type esterase/lipase family protein [Paenibacillus]